MSLSNEKSTEVKNPFSIKVDDLKLRGRNRKFPRFEIACERRLEEREIGNKRGGRIGKERIVSTWDKGEGEVKGEGRGWER